MTRLDLMDLLDEYGRAEREGDKAHAAVLRDRLERALRDSLKRKYNQ